MNRLVAWITIACFFGLLLAQGDYQKGISFYKQKQYDKAVTEFEAIVKEHTDYEFGQRMLGLCYLNLKQNNKAIAAFQKAIKLKKENFVSHSGLAHAYFNSGRYQDAMNVLRGAEQYAKSARDQYRLYRTLGTAAFNLQDYSSAARNLNRAIGIQRGNPADLLQLGISYYHLDRRSEAQDLLEQVVSLNPNLGQAKVYLEKLKSDQAVAAIEAGDYQKAANLLRAQVEKEPQDEEAWFNLGLAYMFSGNLDAAEESFRRVTRLAPTHGDSFDRLGYIYEKRRAYNKALEAYQKAYELQQKAEIKESVDRIRKRIDQARRSG